MNVTFIRTRYSVTFPFSMTTCWLLIQAPLTFRSVLSARAMPDLIASSKLLVDDDWISVIFATAMVHPAGLEMNLAVLHRGNDDTRDCTARLWCQHDPDT